MTTELQQHLKKEYPFLQTVTRSRGHFCIEVLDGWYSLLYDMCTEIQAAGGDFIPTQIGQKGGRLQVQYKTSSHRIKEIVNRYETISETVCEQCGELGFYREEFMIALCDTCYTPSYIGGDLMMVTDCVDLCPICQHIKDVNSPDHCDCVRTGRISKGDLVRADKRLLGVAQKLTDKGFRVLRCKVYETYTSDSTAIGIHLREVYNSVIGLFTEMPPDWFMDTVGPQDGEQYVHSELVDYWPHSDDPEEYEYQLKLTIQNLESWLDTLDSEGTKAVLTLAGYRLGPIKRISEVQL